jgi:hypothetical protein
VTDYGLSAVGVNDRGFVVFTAGDKVRKGDVLVEYADPQFIPLMVAEEDAPTPSGQWPRPTFAGAKGPNQLGNVAFVALATGGSKPEREVFFWDYPARNLTAVALKGMPAVNDLVFADVGTPAINNVSEIAIPAKGSLWISGRD